MRRSWLLGASQLETSRVVMVAVKEEPEVDSIDGRRRHTIAGLAARSRGSLLRYFARKGMTAEEAEDSAQEVFLRLSRNPAFADHSGVEGYLFETAASVAVDHFRRQRSRSADRHTVYDEALHARPIAGADRAFEDREQLSLALSVLRDMPERTRNVVILARLERMRQAEIARRLGISVSAVEKHLVRGLARLGERIGRGQS